MSLGSALHVMLFFESLIRAWLISCFDMTSNNV
jgi:hypothetical protein